MILLCDVHIYIRWVQVRKVLSLQSNRSYYPFISFQGNYQYYLHWVSLWGVPRDILHGPIAPLPQTIKKYIYFYISYLNYIYFFGRFIISVFWALPSKLLCISSVSPQSTGEMKEFPRAQLIFDHFERYSIYLVFIIFCVLSCVSHYVFPFSTFFL